MCLDCYGLWYDEVASIEIARRGIEAILTDRFGGMLVQTPLHYLLVWLTIQPVDPVTNALLLRLPSAVAGALTPLVVYELGKETFGRAQGLLAALIVAISAVHIGHSQDVRPYTLLVLFSALSVYSLLKAEKTGRRGWWAVFTLVTILDLHFSYFALTLFLPALAPYLLWLIYKSWGKRSSESTTLRNALLSLGAIALAAVPLLLDLLQLHRTAPDWDVFFDIVGRQVALLPARLAQLGIAGSTEEAIQWGFVILAVVGALAAVRQKKSKAAALCVLMILMPALLLAVFRTSNIIFQRYALFAMPFYFLLLANGVVFLWRARPTWGGKMPQYVAGAVGTLLMLLFAYSSFLYFSPEQHRRLSFLPDYRGVATYLTRQAGPEDLIVLVDEPALGVAVVDFYWRDKRPTTVLDARDPRLFTARPVGSIFWVVSFFQNNPDFTTNLSAPDQGWTNATHFERIVVLEQGGPPDIFAGMERLISKMEQQLPDYQPVRTLRGCILQARGGKDAAAEAYRSAGAYYPQLGEEFLATAQGFQARGQPERAWREAITSKFMRPGNPQVHRWLADNLPKTSSPTIPELERQIANALDDK